MLNWNQSCGCWFRLLFDLLCSTSQCYTSCHNHNLTGCPHMCVWQCLPVQTAESRTAVLADICPRGDLPTLFLSVWPLHKEQREDRNSSSRASSLSVKCVGVFLFFFFSPLLQCPKFQGGWRNRVVVVRFDSSDTKCQQGQHSELLVQLLWMSVFLRNYSTVNSFVVVSLHFWVTVTVNLSEVRCLDRCLEAVERLAN